MPRGAAIFIVLRMLYGPPNQSFFVSGRSETILPFSILFLFFVFFSLFVYVRAPAVNNTWYKARAADVSLTQLAKAEHRLLNWANSQKLA